MRAQTLWKTTPTKSTRLELLCGSWHRLSRNARWHGDFAIIKGLVGMWQVVQGRNCGSPRGYDADWKEGPERRKLIIQRNSRRQCITLCLKSLCSCFTGPGIVRRPSLHSNIKTIFESHRTQLATSQAICRNAAGNAEYELNTLFVHCQTGPCCRASRTVCSINTVAEVIPGKQQAPVAAPTCTK